MRLSHRQCQQPFITQLSVSSVLRHKTNEMGTCHYANPAIHNPMNLTIICPGKPRLPQDKLADALQSEIINAFEAAIEQGMSPMDALAAILSWMSSEMTRIQADQANRARW